MNLRHRNDKAAADDGDTVVELTRVPFIGEAIAIKQDLGRIGILASVFESDSGGWAPHLGVDQGNRVMVLARDVARAKELLSTDGGQLAVDPGPTFPPVTKHLRRHEAD
jgi:hypothetical protein